MTHGQPYWESKRASDVRVGDRVRLNRHEAEVESVALSRWHVDNTNQYQPRAWEHDVAHVRLAGRGPLYSWPAGMKIEILCDPALLYAEALVKNAFPRMERV